MISINNISFEFGGRYLYKNASWHIKPGERIGLIGMNGTGKSTLLRVINGEYQVSEGSISKPRGLTIGFLNQDQLSFETTETILNVALGAFERALQLEKEIEEVLHKMETDHSDAIINLLSDKQHEFEQLDGYNLHHKTEKVLEGLGFTTEQLSQPYSKFSGGWRMRVLLAKMLLQNPNLLMLDEPTNHLDLPTIEWLEEYLRNYDGTVIVVSHDRQFLDRMVTKIVEVAMQKLTEFPGNYSNYLVVKADRSDLMQRQFDNQQQFIKQQEQFINRFKAKASKATAAQSRVKMLEKLDRIEAPEEDNREINIQFRIAQQSGKVVTDLKHVSKSFPDVNIVKNAERHILKGDKIALIGANGKGKSTMLRMIAGTEPYEGQIIRGHNVNMAFYAQHQLESLNIENEILEEMRQNAGERTENELRNLLGCFLFAGDEVFKKIKVLSGGEKARVALAKTLLEEANFLLLDEPTNHLDIRSINILIQSLQQYEGTFLVVSHDRHFVSSVANKIWWIEDQELKEYPGTYAEYEYWHKKQEEEKSKATQKSKAEKVVPVKTEAKKTADKEKKVSNNHVLNLQKKFDQLEADMALLKAEIAQNELDFGNPAISNNSAKLQTLRHSYDHNKARLQQLENEYEQIFEALTAAQ
ncbi:MAG: ABC-F family ATP-binding cassette domain-containing protein [Bacteroidia bacterium]|jgi:ATP-binding cassette subfamily F protein 3